MGAGGALGVLINIHQQMKSAVEDPNVDGIYKEYAIQGLRDVTAEIENFKNGRTN